MNDDRSLARRLGTTGWALVAAWVLLAGLLVFALASARDYFEVAEARTPDLVGLPLAEAARLAEEGGLTLRSYPTSVAGAAANAVTEQSPPPGAIVRRGRDVSVGVNVPAEADRMPSLVGTPIGDARATLRRLALPAPDVAYAYDPRPAGQVVDQQPAAGGEVRAGDPLRLVVSRGEGPLTVELPDLVGLEVESARTQLAALGVRRVETVPIEVSMLRAGTVLEQEPPAGTAVNAGLPVVLGYALEGERVVEVPDVVGMSPLRARVALRAAGLAIGPVEVVHDPERPEGVVGSRPAGLTVAGSPVVLVVNAAPGETVDLRPEAAPERFDFDFDFDERGARPDPGDADGGDDDAPADRDGPRLAGDLGPGGRQVPFRFDPNALGVRSLVSADYELRLVVSDERGERTAIEETVEAGDVVQATVVVYGEEPLLQTYVNGVFFQAWRP